MNNMTVDRSEKRARTNFLCLFCVGLWLLAGYSMVYGARVAGEEGVTPAAPQATGPEAGQPAAVPPAEEPTAEGVMPPEAPEAAPPAAELPVTGGREKRWRPAAPEGTPPSVATPPDEGPPSVAPPPRVPVRKRPVPAQQQRRPEPAQISATETPDERYVTIDFDDVEITLFIKFISELTGKNFVVDKAVRGKVTIVSPTKISVDEAYKVFESVLEVYGFATVPAGSVVKVVPAVEARSKSIETRLRQEAIDPEDRVVTQLIPLEYADPDELKKLFAPLISKSSVIISYAPTATLIVTDVLSNINRLLRIVKAVDVVGIGEEISVVPLQNATASVLVNSLTSVFQTTARKRGAPQAPGIKIVADERTNSLIIAATEDDSIKVKQLIELLDKEIPEGEGDIRVHYLQNASAEDLAQVLTALPTREGGPPQKGRPPLISKEVQIVADKATNSLVITANKDDYLILEDVIKKLDIPRTMVYIEALLMEVSLNKQFSLGVQWQVADDIGGYEDRDLGMFGASTPPQSQLPSRDATTEIVSLPTGFSFGVLGETINISGIEFPTIGAVVRAYQSDSDVHILSTPQIMTTDNEEAQIIVAKNIPYLTRQETSAAGVDYSNYEFKDVGVTLKITPQINQERFVRLKVYWEFSQVVDQEALGLPTTLKRQAETTVIIKDGNTVVYAGLIDETLNQGTYRVPCLGNIPFFGWLFKTVGSSGDRTNLFVFLTPHIIENPREAQQVYEKKRGDMETIKEGVIKMYERTYRGGEKPEVKPEIKPEVEPDVQPDVESEVESEVEPEIELEAEPLVETQ